MNGITIVIGSLIYGIAAGFGGLEILLYIFIGHVWGIVQAIIWSKYS